MARRRRRSRGESISSYFRSAFQENPAWLQANSNELVLAKYKEDHGISAEAPLSQSIKAGMASAKHIMRKKLGVGPKRGRKVGRAIRAAVAALPEPRRKSATLEHLEELIDECLTLAKNLDREGLTKVIHLLRNARNEVVWKHGQPG